MNGLHSDVLRPFLARLTVRSILTDEEQQAVLDLPGTLAIIDGRRDFVHLREEVRHSCLVVSGLVARFNQTSSGARQITGLHLPGEMPDLFSAVRPVGIGGLMALCDTRILRVPHTAIQALAARHPAVAEAFWRDCILDAAILAEWVVNVGKRSGEVRLAHLFCEMALRYGHSIDVATGYGFPLSQEQLGEAASLTGVHVNRCLRSLREMGLLIFKGGRVQILNWEALVRFGDFDATYLVADTAPNRQQRYTSAA
jgi:CRP-like cAMP-binding protein